jgi:tRNA G10  N-methylase Trm11
MGAYYTKEDITGYISKNTIIPFIFDTVLKRHPAAASGENSIWCLLADDPDRYIYPSVRQGVEIPLPDEIAAGLNDISRRTEWNKPALPEYALLTEIWREVVARRKRYEEISTLLVERKIASINDLITYNLNIRQFAQDVVENIEDPDLLRTFYHTIAGRIPEKSNEKFAPGISVLDPTCGSGAFLFAALNILEPLYEACLDRMQSFVDDLERSGEKHSPQKFADFRKILEQVKQHPNRRYFVLKSIIMNNLYGVDIMEEATEICKLRLFLKLVAQVERVENIEPLPDIDFNIRTGNTLVGFATYAEVEKAVAYETSGQMKMEFVNPMVRLEEKAQDADRLFNLFRQMQTGQDMVTEDFTKAKQKLRERLRELGNELDHYMASWYGIDQNHFPKAKEYDQKFQSWRQSHKPFHWFVEFYGILKDGGFDMIIGNPPYVKYSKVKIDYTIHNYHTIPCGNLYAFVIERSLSLLRKSGRCGVIIPIASVSTENMRELQQTYNNYLQWHSHFATRPGKLFFGVDMNLTISLLSKSVENCIIYSTTYRRWSNSNEIERNLLFQNIHYMPLLLNNNTHVCKYPKYGEKIELDILNKMLNHNIKLERYIAAQGKIIYYHSGGRYWRMYLSTEIYPRSSLKMTPH